MKKQEKLPKGAASRSFKNGTKKRAFPNALSFIKTGDYNIDQSSTRRFS